MEQKEKLNTLVLYTCATCNLNCRYCNIDKNPALKMIDNILAESYETDYYFEKTKKYFPDRTQLEKIEIWGGEPIYHVERIDKLLSQIIEYYPYFDSFFSSTNFSYPQWVDKVLGLFKVFGKYPYRKFHITLQLSCDGPEYINDASRGKGVTARCIENFDKLLSVIGNNMSPNIQLHLAIKQTLDVDSVKLLQTKESIIEYYKFFEDNFIDKVEKLNYTNVYMPRTVPNMAVPSPATIKNGEEFANLARLCREIEKEKVLKYYELITPMTPIVCQTALTYCYSKNNCGIGSTMIGFLPNDIICKCHAGFVDFVSEYKKYYNEGNEKIISLSDFLKEQPLSHCVTEEEYKQFEYKMSLLNQDGTYSRLVALTNEILALAMSGQIDKKFLNYHNALKAAIHVQSTTPFCIRDNYDVTGSIELYPLGNVRQVLVGGENFTWLEEENQLDE